MYGPVGNTSFSTEMANGWVPEEGAVQRGCEKATKIFVLPSDICTGGQSLLNREWGKTMLDIFARPAKKVLKQGNPSTKHFAYWRIRRNLLVKLDPRVKQNNGAYKKKQRGEYFFYICLADLFCTLAGRKFGKREPPLLSLELWLFNIRVNLC